MPTLIDLFSLLSFVDAIRYENVVQYVIFLSKDLMANKVHIEEEMGRGAT